MTKEHSFDITAEFDKQEMKNTIEQAKKEVHSRVVNEHNRKQVGFDAVFSKR